MAILDLGLSLSSAGSESLQGVRIYAGGVDPDDIFVKFSTESGLDWQDTFDISCCTRAVPRAGTGISEDGYSQWAEFVWSSVPASECHPHQVPGNSRWWWAIPLSAIGEYKNGSTDPSAWGSIEGALFPKGYGFDERTQDAINLQVHVKSHFVSGKQDANGATVSNLAEANSLWVGYFPDYVLKGAKKTGSGLVIEYTSPGWERNDDRFAVRGLSQFGNILKAGNWYGNANGYSMGAGSISIPFSWLTRVPSEQQLRVDIRMNASFRDIEMEFGELVGTVSVIDKTSCSTPTLKVVSATQDMVQIQLGDAGDHPDRYVVANCMISDDVVDTDAATVVNGGVYTISYPPLGRDFEVAAIGLYGADAISKVARVTVPAIDADGKMLIAPIDTGFDQVELRYDVSEDWDFEQDMEVVKFSGRPYESVAYGFGGKARGTFKCSIVEGESFGDAAQDVSDFENLMFARTCILRGPDGERRRVAVESVNPKWNTTRTVRTISISVRQVP